MKIVYQTYVDSAVPDDSQSGTDPGTPKKLLREVIRTWKHGTAVYLKYGRHYDNSTGGLGLVNRHGLKIVPYGDPSLGLPIIDGMYYEPRFGSSGWNHEGEGLYSKVIGTPDSWDSTKMPRRMFTGTKFTGNLRGQRDPGVARSRTPNTNISGFAPVPVNTVASLLAWFKANPRDIWHPSDSTLGWKTFVYTGDPNPATGTPPVFYDGICFSVCDQKTIGAGDSPLHVTGARDVEIANIEMWGGLGIGFRISASNTDANGIRVTRDVRIHHCVHRYGYGGSFGMAPQANTNGNPRAKVISCVIEDCYANSMSGPLEQEIDERYGAKAGAMDMYQIIDGCEDCHIRRCEAVDSFHAHFTLGASTWNTAIPKDSGFEDCWMYASSWNAYARGLNVYNTEKSCYVRRTHFEGQNVQSQVAGKVRITSCWWYGFRPAIRKPGTDGWIAAGNLVIDRGSAAAGDNTYVRMQPRGLVIEHSYVEDPYGVPVDLQTFDYAGRPYAAPEFADRTFIVANTVIYDRRRPTLPWLRMEERTVPIGVQITDSNAVYKGEGAPAPFVQKKLTNGSLLNFVFDNLPGGTGNIEVHPMIERDASSGFVIDRKSPLRRAGRRYSKARDSRGRPFMNPPTIGPLEFTSGMPRT